MKIGSQLQTMAMRDKRRRVLDWISGILPEGSNAKFSRAKPINGTCQWLLTEPEYEKWRDGSNPGFFWLKGKSESPYGASSHRSHLYANSHDQWVPARLI